jgi:hypothetical protein
MIVTDVPPAISPVIGLIVVNEQVCAATVIESGAVPFPVAFVPVTMYSVFDCARTGRPLIAPVLVLSVRPVGSDGDTENDVIPPPVDVIV